MRNPKNVLNSLSKHSGNLNYKFERLYRVLFNEEMSLSDRFFRKIRPDRRADGKPLTEKALTELNKPIVSK